MSAFSTDWLALREPFDHAAREAAAGALDLQGLGARLRAESGAHPLRVLDLASGTGANLRELAPRLGGAQHWVLADHDPRLLAALPDVLAAWCRMHGHVFHAQAEGLCIEGPDWEARVQPLRIDLATSLDALPWAGARLVTASALLDLVSATWLDTLCAHARSAGAAMLFALNVDGQVGWEPAMEGDAEVHRLFAAHQRRDKGFGPALGGEAIERATQRLAALGYGVVSAASEWHIDGSTGAQAVAMLRAMIAGTGDAAIEQTPAARGLVAEWKTRRLERLALSRLRVGHRDLLATPAPGNTRRPRRNS